MSWGRSLRRQFARPRGLGGLVAGELLAWSNREVNRWTVRLLGLARGDRVLEVGFGPGLGIRLAASRARRGLVAGIDPAEVMVRRARWRNRRGVRVGRIDLRQGSATALPWPQASFTHAFAVNAVNEWPDPERALAELLGVLRPRGRLALTSQERQARSPERADARAWLLLERVRAAGFGEARLERLDVRPPAFCVVATHPSP